MLSLITLLLTHLISIWTDLILILLPCNLNAHNYCNYATEGNSSSMAGRPKFRTSWHGLLLAGWTHSHLRAGSLWEHRCPPPPHLSEVGILGFIPVMGWSPANTQDCELGVGELTLSVFSSSYHHPLLHCSAWVSPFCRHPHIIHIPRLPYL